MATNAPHQNQTRQNSRGIQNVQVTQRVSTSDERFNEQIEGRLMRAQFIKGEDSRQGRPEANDPEYEEDKLIKSEERVVPPRTAEVLRQNIERKKKEAIIRKKKTVPVIGTTAKWMVFSAVCISYIFQLLFGLLSLLVAVSGELVSSSFLGSIVDLFTDVSSGFKSAGIGLWGISALIVFLTFICVWAWYRFLGFNPFETVMSMFITLVLLSMSLLPLMNLFPWLVLWVVYLNASLLFIKR